MKNIPLLIIIVVLITMLCTSCATHRATRLIAKGKRLIDKGVALDPRLADSVYRVKDVETDLPSIDAGAHVAAPFDSASWKAKVKEYDDLLHSKDELIEELYDKEDATTILTDARREEIGGQLATTERSLDKIRRKFLQGFAPDSTYRVHPDTLTTIDVFVRSGRVDSIGFHRDEQVVKAKVNTLDINLNRCPPRLQDPWWWWAVVGSLILGFVLAILVNRWSTRPRQS